ncbi:MAG: hypothetical protein GMKNLPBB_00704 [Myxococcota bacterium]|nr:hypothetical protein [Myxococcota bacterium]
MIPSTKFPRRHLLLAPAALVLLAGCASDNNNPPANQNNNAGGQDAAGPGPATGGAAASPDETAFRPRANPIEYIGLTVERDMTLDEFVAMFDPILGDGASAGQFASGVKIKENIEIGSSADPQTPDQILIQGDLIPVEPANENDKRRTMMRAPASKAYGKLFMDAVRTATATALEVQQKEPGGGAPFWLEYRSRSSNGGSLGVRFDFEPKREPRTKLVLNINTPQTSLSGGKLNGPAFSGKPYESIAGTAWFAPSRDEFTFFVQRAYGISPGADQNFRDFQLLPHKWLRLTVTPKLKDKFIDVAFEVVKLDKSRVPFARAPASFIAGDQFRQAVFVMLDQNEREQKEGKKPTDWQAPFYYDDPHSGGVVAVVATGKAGRFDIAYAVESPINFLRDVDFVPYPKTMEIPETWPTKQTKCSELGSYEAPQGRFKVRFVSSDVIRKAEKEGRVKAPLKGTVSGSIYKSEDVTIAGPKEGTKPVASFKFENVSIEGGRPSTEFLIEDQVPAGDYQVLGFMDIDGNADPKDPGPDQGDPVFIPIGGYKLSCFEQPFDVQFAILLPKL